MWTFFHISAIFVPMNYLLIMGGGLMQLVANYNSHKFFRERLIILSLVLTFYIYVDRGKKVFILMVSRFS